GSQDRPITLAMKEKNVGLVQVLANCETGSRTKFLTVDKQQGSAGKRHGVIQNRVFKNPCAIEYGWRFGDGVLVHTPMLNQPEKWLIVPPLRGSSHFSPLTHR